MDVLPGMAELDNVDWVHLAATIDTWGHRGTTSVTPEGDEVPQLVTVNMIHQHKLTPSLMENLNCILAHV